MKSRQNASTQVEAFLVLANAVYTGTDHQKGIYFNVPDGRLKLRTGNIENALIFYRRNNQKGPKQSDFNLVPLQEVKSFELLLTEALGIKVVVKKTQTIFS